MGDYIREITFRKSLSSIHTYLFESISRLIRRYCIRSVFYLWKCLNIYYFKTGGKISTLSTKIIALVMQEKNWIVNLFGSSHKKHPSQSQCSLFDSLNCSWIIAAKDIVRNVSYLIEQGCPDFYHSVSISFETKMHLLICCGLIVVADDWFLN